MSQNYFSKAKLKVLVTQTLKKSNIKKTSIVTSI